MTVNKTFDEIDTLKTYNENSYYSVEDIVEKTHE